MDNRDQINIDQSFLAQSLLILARIDEYDNFLQCVFYLTDDNLEICLLKTRIKLNLFQVMTRLIMITGWQLIMSLMCTAVMRNVFKATRVRVPTLSMQCYSIPSRGVLETSAKCANSSSCMAAINYSNRSAVLCTKCDSETVTIVPMNSRIYMRLTGQEEVAPGNKSKLIALDTFWLQQSEGNFEPVQFIQHTKWVTCH